MDSQISLPKELHSKSASKLLGDVLIKLMKQDIFERFIKTDTISEDDREFCDKIGWYPVDELELREEYAEKLSKIKEGPHIPMTLEEFNNKCDSL